MKVRDRAPTVSLTITTSIITRQLLLFGLLASLLADVIDGRSSNLPGDRLGNRRG